MVLKRAEKRDVKTERIGLQWRGDGIRSKI